MTEKIIRDPVHDVIAFRLDRPVEALLFRLIGSVEFQRLRRIRQLGMTSLAYPGADHSRYSHSLGVMETARRILEQIRPMVRIGEEEETVCLVAALLHDLGHGPLSHLFERVSGIEHERLTQRIILDGESEVGRLLGEHDRQLPQRVVSFLRCQPGRTFLNDIVCSQLDADRFDYLLRDNLMTGSGYGGFDLSWLLHALVVDEEHNRLAVTAKGVSAVESYLQSRFHMYRNVYFHKVVRSAEGMVRLALQRAKRLAVQDRLPWPVREDAVHKALLGQRLTMGEFTELDDISVLQCFKLWSNSEDVVLAGLCRGLLYRRVYKTVNLMGAADASEAAEQVAAAEGAMKAAGGDPAYDMFYDEPTETPYEKYSPEEGEHEILVKSLDGKVTAFAEISPLPDALNRQLMFRRIHVAEAWKDVVVKAVEGG